MRIGAHIGIAATLIVALLFVFVQNQEVPAEDVKHLGVFNDTSSDIDTNTGSITLCRNTIIRTYRKHDDLLTVSDMTSGKILLRITEEDGVLSNPGNATVVCSDNMVLIPLLKNIALLNLDTLKWQTVIDDDLEWYINIVSMTKTSNGYAVLVSYDDEQAKYLQEEKHVEIGDVKGGSLSALLFFDQNFNLLQRYRFEEAIYSSISLFNEGDTEYLYFGFGSYDKQGGGIYAFRKTEEGINLFWKHDNSLCPYGVLTSPFTDISAKVVHTLDLCGNLFSLDTITGEKVMVHTPQNREGEIVFSYASPIIADFNTDLIMDIAITRNIFHSSESNTSPESNHESFFVNMLRGPGGESSVIVVDGSTGDTLWEKKVNGFVMANPVLFTTGNNTATDIGVFTMPNTMMYTISGTDGSLIQKAVTESMHLATPVLADAGGNGVLDMFTLWNSYQIQPEIPISNHIYSGFRGQDNRGAR